MPSANLTEKLSELMAERSSATIEVPGWALTLDAVKSDTIGCKLNSLRLRSLHSDDPLDADKLTLWAKSIASRVTGFLEPLRVVEVDATQKMALLRSDKPTVSGKEALYYEVLLLANRTCDLHRYRGYFEDAKIREKVPFAVTHEVLAKFVDDVTK